MNQLGSRDEAEDAVQSTFLNAHRALQRGVTPEAELAWLFKIAHNVCLTRRRSSRRRGRVEAPSDLDAVQDVLPAPARESADELIRLTDALAHMPDNQRRAILLREWQGLSYHEIAAELQLSQSAVETLIFRARRTLAANLEVEPERPTTLARVRRALDIGSLLGAVKTLIAAGTAMQATAAAVAVSGAAVVATSPAVRHHAPPAKRAPAPAIVQQQAPAAAHVERIARVDAPTQAVVTPTQHAAKPKPEHVKPIASPPAAKAPAPAPTVQENRSEPPAASTPPAPGPAATAPAATAPPAPATTDHGQGDKEKAKAETPAPARSNDRGEKKDKKKDDAPPAASAPDKSGHGNGDRGDKKDKGDKGGKGKDSTATTNFVPPAGPVVAPPVTTPEPVSADAAATTPTASDDDDKGKDHGGDKNRGKGKPDD